MEFYHTEIKVSLTMEEMELLKNASSFFEKLYFGMGERSCGFLRLNESGSNFTREKIDEISVLLKDFSAETITIE